jgi:hypothetical protein
MKISNGRAPRLGASPGHGGADYRIFFMGTVIKAAAGRPSGRRRSSQIVERVKNPKITLVQCNFHGKTSFDRDDNPLAPALPPSGTGAHCDVSELPAWKLSAGVCARNTVLSQPGMPWRRGRSLKERHDLYQMISTEKKKHRDREEHQNPHICLCFYYGILFCKINYLISNHME